MEISLDWNDIKSHRHRNILFWANFSRIRSFSLTALEFIKSFQFCVSMDFLVLISGFKFVFEQSFSSAVQYHFNYFILTFSNKVSKTLAKVIFCILYSYFHFSNSVAKCEGWRHLNICSWTFLQRSLIEAREMFSLTNVLGEKPPQEKGASPFLRIRETSTTKHYG